MSIKGRIKMNQFSKKCLKSSYIYMDLQKFILSVLKFDITMDIIDKVILKFVSMFIKLSRFNQNQAYKIFFIGRWIKMKV